VVFTALMIDEFNVA